MEWALILTSLAFPAWTETTTCEGTDVSVISSVPEFADATCRAVRHAATLFDHCRLPALEGALRIEIVTELEAGSVAAYHYRTGRIELLEPPLMEAQRRPDAAFSFLAKEDYFRSVVVHELAHTIFDYFPCPFASCPATNEYFAYVMQVMSLKPGQQDTFAANSAVKSRVSREDFSLMILLMAPDRFAQKAWTHVMQQDDQCAFVRHILDGAVLLDHDRF